MIYMKNKRGISPIIATVLLISMIVIIAIIIFLWARGFLKEAVMKNSKGAEQNCKEVNLETSLSGNLLSVINRGNVPVNGLYVEKTNAGRVEVQKFEKAGLGLGKAGEFDLVGNYDKVEIVPVILGTVKNIKTSYVCENDKKEVNI